MQGQGPRGSERRDEDIGIGRPGRAGEVSSLDEFERRQRDEGISERGFAEEIGIPRTTLQHWRNRKDGLAASPAAVAFFESPEGVEFLHRFTVAAHLVMNWMGACGIRLVCLLIELTGLDPFIASSYGAQQKLSAKLQSALVDYGGEERARLAQGMERKRITVCEDETFLSEDICLVAMEPVSGFLLLEDYASQRDAETWNTAMADGTAGLNVEVIQSTADEASALARHAKDMSAEHSPDLFHVQNEVNRAMALPLLRNEARAREVLGRAEVELAGQVEAKRAYWAGTRVPGRPPGFDKRIAEAKATTAEAACELERAQEHRRAWVGAVRSIEAAYHPYDLDSGKPRSTEQVAGELESLFDKLDAIAADARLSTKSEAGLRKARRVTPKMVASMGFVHEQIQGRVEALGLPAEQETLLSDNLVPAAYLHRVASRTQDRDKRHRLRTTLDLLTSELIFPGGIASRLDEHERQLLEKAAYDCADVFQRSSSCIEGRNGRLSLWEHAMRRLQPKKLAGLTVIHNYFIKRPDGTTAAERFFSAPPRDLFAWLLERLPMPSRPARRRPRPEKQPLFQAG